MDFDLEEFLEVAVPTSTGDEPSQVGTLLNSVRGESRSEKAEKNLGALSQYASIGDGYIPTTGTVATLKPDCYTIQITPPGQVVFNSQKLVTDNLLRLPDSKSEAVIKEVEMFWTLKSKFKEYGFAHKRGMLLWGPPGSGKSSTVSMIINDMVKAGGVVLLADHPSFLAAALKQFRTVEPERPLVVVWEDIDAVIQNYGESMVLSILDGEAQVENVVFIATTNYPEKLDGRVINRPSRFDKIIKIGMPNDKAREMYLKSKLEHTVYEDVDLVKATDGLSIAHLKELIVSIYCYQTPVKETLDRLLKMKIKVKSDNDSGPLGFR